MLPTHSGSITSKGSSGNSHPPIKTLLVEDNPGDIRLVEILLATKDSSDVRIRDVESLSNALAELKRQKFDVVLLDLSLPDSQGLDTFRVVHAEYPDIPVVVMTGLEDEEMGARAVREGAQDYIPKSRLDGNLLHRSIRYAMERMQSELTIRNSLREKEILLRELHDRVKTNLEIIANIIKLQARRINDRAMNGIFDETKNRISAMAFIHEKLYRSSDLAGLNFPHFVWQLTNHLYRTFNINPQRIRLNLRFEAANIHLNLNSAVPCGLITNELITNSILHAFPDEKSGQVTVGFFEERKGYYTISVADDGVGFKRSDLKKEVSGLGLELVEALAIEIRGRVEYLTDGKTEIRVTFPVG